MNKWELFKEHYWNWLGIFGWCLILALLVSVKKYGSAVVIEPTLRILWAELIVIVPGIILLGIFRDIKDWRK